METPASGHEPVLLAETLSLLDVREGQTVVDCTVGRAGHARALAGRLGATGLLIGLDVDPANLRYAQDRLADAACQVRLFHANFAELGDVLREAGVQAVDGLLADLGVSTNQLFDPRYGLSFSQDMPLDMRLDPRLERTAADIVNTWSEEELADLLYELAQERDSRRIARKIIEARRVSPMTTTGRLADVVRSAARRRGGAPEKIDPATRTFLALRMAVNSELDNLRSLLGTIPARLRPGGRAAVIAFQSMEDRLVKQTFRAAQRSGLVEILTRKCVVPGESERKANPRSRSAKLRAIRRL